MKNIINKIKPKIKFFIFFNFISISVSFAATTVDLEEFKGDISNTKSLQNGAKLFFNYCYGCHSLSLMRYDRISEDLDLDVSFLKKYAADDGVMISTMKPNLAENWFGITPPDLTLSARVRGEDWIYTYLKSYYADSKARWGVNNKVLANSSMPNILSQLEKTQTKVEFNKSVTDIVNFLSYTAEPIKLKRYKIGVWVIGFLIILLILTYLLKREYWKDVYHGKWRAKD